jgi:hypothetical protein
MAHGALHGVVACCHLLNAGAMAAWGVCSIILKAIQLLQSIRLTCLCSRLRSLLQQLNTFSHSCTTKTRC